MEYSCRSFTRRQFGFAAGSWALASRLFGASDQSMPWTQPATVRTVFLATPKPTWPKPDLNVGQEKAEMESTLAEAALQQKGAVQFTGRDLVRSAEDAQTFVGSLGDEDAVLVVDLTSGSGPLLAPLKRVQKPVLLYSRPYSGWSYVEVAAWAQAGKRADLIVTSDPAELGPYLTMFRTIRHLRKSKILVVSQATRSDAAEAFTRQFGTTFAFPGFGALKDAYHSCDERKAAAAADSFARGALKVVEPNRQEITDSFRLYDAVLKLLASEKANAITVDCLGGFRRGDLPAYPCVAWTKLNDAGFYGVCEADIASTMTQLLLTSFSRKAAFVSDPVFDTGRNEVIHAHCVSATKLMGLDGPSSPYAIRSHMEDNKGVSLQVMVPTNEKVTVAKFLKPDVFGVSLGEVTANVDDARGCRTKFRTKVADARKMVETFTGGLHRVVVYGDYLQPVERMGRLMGFQVVHEG
ncbi:MAG: hypothetical protein ACKV22_38020 [Bryobacteraceae bacterium]